MDNLHELGLTINEDLEKEILMIWRKKSSKKKFFRL